MARNRLISPMGTNPSPKFRHPMSVHTVATVARRTCTSGGTRTALSRRGCMMGWGAWRCGTANFGRHDRWPRGVPVRCAIIHLIAHLMRIEHGTWRRLMKGFAVSAARARSIYASERPLPSLTHESRYRRPGAQRYNGWAPPYHGTVGCGGGGKCRATQSMARGHALTCAIKGRQP